MKDIINGLFVGCIQNKAILISMSVGRHDMGVWKYWIFFFFFGLKRWTGQTIMTSIKEWVFNCSSLGTNIVYPLEFRRILSSTSLIVTCYVP